MALVDDIHVQWPDAVLPGSRAAKQLFAAYWARGKAEDERRAEAGSNMDRYGDDG